MTRYAACKTDEAFLGVLLVQQYKDLFWDET